MRRNNNRTRGRGGRSGFTLIELMLVALVLSVVAALVAPRVVPMIAFSQLEGAARHVAGYGRASMAYCAFRHEYITVNFDLDNQEYWSALWADRMDELEKEEKEDKTEREREAEELAERILDSPEDDMMRAQALEALNQLSQVTGEENNYLAMAMQERFERFARISLESRARNVKHDSIMDEFGPLFDKEFDLDDGKDDEKTEVKSDLLIRTKLPKGIEIESIDVGGTSHMKGTVEIDVGPSGLYDFVRFYVVNEDEEYLTVEWDAITGRSHLYPGKEKGQS